MFQNHDEVGGVLCYGPLYQRLLTSARERAAKRFHYPRRGEGNSLFPEVQFRRCFRSIGRLKAGAKVVGRETARELRKKQFLNDLGDKGNIRDGTIILQSILVKR